MEDACVAFPYLLEVALSTPAAELLPPRIAPQLRGSPAAERAAERSGAPGCDSTFAARAESWPSAGCGAAPSEGAPPPPLDIPARDPPGHVAAETLHFFGVFDGHGGADAAVHCAKTLHRRVRDALVALASPPPPDAAAGAAAAGAPGEASSIGDPATAGGARQQQQQQQLRQQEPPPGGAPTGGGGDLPRPGTPTSRRADPHGLEFHSASSGSSEEMEDAEEGSASAAVDAAAAAAAADVAAGAPCTTEHMEAALARAFHLVDEEFGSMGGYEHLALVGTTAVVVLVGSRMLYVANCGDSRAVLCRGGLALPLTDDHKAAREDETARVEAAGGQILFWNGVRVMGLLAVSRAIGDHSLRPYVIAEPEVTVLARHASDELLVLASDGLWDVMSNQEACGLAKKCLQRARQRGSTRQSAARVAATVLTRAAVDRGSRDNVTVVIVDMAELTEEEAAAEEEAKQVRRRPSAQRAAACCRACRAECSWDCA
jgi:protein phosphatase 2C